jgi:hypothetical protein
MKKSLCLLLVVGSLFSGATAQAESFTHPERPFSIGLNAYQGNYEVFFPQSPNATGAGPWQLVVDYAVSPRFSIQLAGNYSYNRFIQDPYYISFASLGQCLDGAKEERRWTCAVPLLARYSVLSSPRHRLQADFIIGGTFLRTHFVSKSEERVNHEVVASYYSEDKVIQAYITAGLGIRYSFWRHLEGVFDYSYSRNFRSAPEAVHLEVTGNKWGLTRAYSLGLRYRFNLKKKVGAPGGA